MPVSVNMPQRKEVKDPLDTIVKGLQVASSIYGIKDANDKAKILADQAAQQKALGDVTLQNAEDTRNGIVTGKELLDKSTSSLSVPAGTPGANHIQVRRGDNIEDVYLMPKPQGTDPEMASLRKLIAQQQLAEMQNKAQQEAFAKTPKGRLEKMSGDQRSRFDNVVMGLNSLTGMENALAAGDNTFRIIGDNDFTLNRRQWEEAIGRMQSGGAINNDEAKRFRALVPTALDSSEIQAKKLAEMRNLMEQRFGTFGFDKSQASDMGLDPARLGFVKSGNVANNGAANVLTIPQANAAGGGQKNGPPNGAMTVQQNGHTYTWNPATGKYE